MSSRLLRGVGINDLDVGDLGERWLQRVGGPDDHDDEGAGVHEILGHRDGGVRRDLSDRREVLVVVVRGETGQLQLPQITDEGLGRLSARRKAADDVADRVVTLGG